jgi:D-arabinose 1-dehydrogenase-like Zn-dependent alcohol dehydrogenase
MSSPQLPKTHRALVLTSTDEPPTVQTIATPQPGPGSVVIQIIIANVISYMRDVYNGNRQYPYPTPLVIGTSAIGRVAAEGPDATALKVGQLVWINMTIRGRDDPDTIMLGGIHQGYSAGSAKLMAGEWRDSTYAEYARLPLENCHALDEARLLGKPDEGGLGYSVEHLAFISGLAVPYGGLRDINLRPSETVIVAPATRAFGGAAVIVALAMGTKVVAMGRNRAALERIAATSDRVRTVQITGDQAAETAALMKYGPIDAFFDISPPEAEKSTHIKAAIMALRSRGRISLMGGIRGDVAIPHDIVMHRNLLIKGTWMYPREYVPELIKMIELGILRLGQGRKCGRFGLKEWKKAFDCAAENAGIGALTLIAPGDA